MTIQTYCRQNKNQLADLMADYMKELDCGIPEDIIRGKLADLIDNQCSAGTIRVDLAMDGDTPAGFSVYQIDAPESDWCKRPGWGFIREFYVVPAYRKKGFGRLLASHTEQALRQMGAVQLYLTSTGAIPFWQRCGWVLTEMLCSNGQYILEKNPISFQLITRDDPLWQSAAAYAAGCSWRAGPALAGLMMQGAFSGWERVAVALEQGRLFGFCTVTKTDCIPDLPYAPYLGYLFIEEAYRGHRLGGQLLDFACRYLHKCGFEKAYLISDHEGLYEKYGFTVIDRKTAPWGMEEKIYAKDI